MFDQKKIRKLSEEFGLSRIIAGLLLSRGITDDIGGFLNPDIRKMHDPYLFSEMGKTVDIIKGHIRSGNRIAIFGDYDSDGICAATILFRTLKFMNADVEVFLPTRADGYGLNRDSIRQIIDNQAKLMVTVDCGISNIEEIRLARDSGLQVVITDHHECPDELPEADAILNPKREGETYPFRELAGGGVAFKLATALIGKNAFETIDIAAVATIGDVVPLLGENRIIAAKGLYKLNAAPGQGLAVLMDEAGLKKRTVDSESVAFGLVPRINASGRIGDPKTALELLCVQKSKQELEAMAKKLCSMNAKRQEMQDAIIKKAILMAEEYTDDRVLVLQDDEWETGIVGLAASVLSGIYAKPAVLFGLRDDLYTGSARSVPGVNIYKEIKKSAHILESFGGHEAAAGLTIKKEKLPALREELNRNLFNDYTEEEFTRKAFYDMEATVAELTANLVEEMNRMKPFGCSNEPVKFLLRDVNVVNKRPIGNGSHSRLRIEQGGTEMDAVAFKTLCDTIPAQMDVLASLQLNDYSGNIELILDVISF